jgi:hypothetical protein
VKITSAQQYVDRLNAGYRQQAAAMELSPVWVALVRQVEAGIAQAGDRLVEIKIETPQLHGPWQERLRELYRGAGWEVEFRELDIGLLYEMTLRCFGVEPTLPPDFSPGPFETNAT